MTGRIAQRALLLTLIAALSPPLLAAGQSGSPATETLVTEARAVLLRGSIDKAGEKRLEQIVLTLGARDASPDARSLVEDLSARAPQIFVAHEEGAVMIPFVDVGAAARVTLRNWTRRTVREEATRALRSGDPQFLQDYFTADAPGQTGMVDAIGEVAPRDLVLHRDELIGRIDEPGGDRLAAAFATSLADTALLESVIIRGSAAVALQTIRKLEPTIGAAAALPLMQMALGRPDIASATLYEVGRLSPTLPAAGLLLWQSLADPQLGGSAAAVVARYADGSTVARLADLLRDSDSSLLQKRALLALRLSGHPRAAQIVDDWLDRQPGGAR